MEREFIDVQLTPEERQLILKYGYPFQGIEASLEAINGSDRIETIAIDEFELERLIGDLTISFNDMQNRRIQDEINDLCERLEYAYSTGDGELDYF